MSDIEHVSCEMSGGIAVSVASTTSDPIWAGDLLKAYQSLSALGDPVKVAEALPELIEAVVNERLCRGAVVGSSDPDNPDWENRRAEALRKVSDAVKQTDDCLSNLKARP